MLLASWLLGPKSTFAKPIGHRQLSALEEDKNKERKLETIDDKERAQNVFHWCTKYNGEGREGDLFTKSPKVEYMINQLCKRCIPYPAGRIFSESHIK